MRVLFYIFTLLCLSSITLLAQNSNDLRASMLTASAWSVDECYIDSMLYPKPITVVSHFYQDGSFTRAYSDTLVPGPIWNFTDNNQLSITYADQTYNELYNIIVLEPNILILKNQVPDSEHKLHTIEIRYKPYIKN